MAAGSAHKFRGSFRSTIVWAVVVLLGVAALLGELLHASYKRHQATAEEISQSLALSAEIFLHSHLQAIDLALQSAATEYSRQHRAGKLDEASFNRYLSELRQRVPYASSVRATDENGVVRWGEGIQPDNLQSQHDREFFQRAKRDRRLTFGIPVVSRISGELLFPIVMPLLRPDGEFGGTANINTSVNNLEKVFASVRIGQHGVINLFDHERRVVARYPPPPKATGNAQPMVLNSPESRAAIADGIKQKSFRNRSRVDGYQRVLTLRQIGDYPLFVIVGLAEKDYLASWHSEAMIGGVFFGVLLLLTVSFCLSLRRRWETDLDQRTMRATRQAHEELAAVVSAIPDSVFEMDQCGVCLNVPSGRSVNAFPGHDNPVGHKACDLLPAEAAQRLGYALREAAELGTVSGVQIEVPIPPGSRWFELSLARKASVPTQQATLIVVSRDISERKQVQAQIEELAFSDQLTRLPNRRLFMDRLRQSMAGSQRSGKLGALIFLDLDNFKAVNDSLGHQYGDMLLVQVAQRLRRIMREDDSVARLGGDEFVVILEQLAQAPEEAAAQAMNVGEKIVAELGGQYELQGRQLNNTVSVGVTLFKGQELSIEELIKRADTSMYQAKSAGRNDVRFFDPATQASMEARLAMEADLRRAVVQDEFVLMYQPQVDVEAKVIGAEVLIRWHSPARGYVAPADFIPLAEETGLISPIGHWVIAEACRSLHTWRDDPLMRHMTLSVNVSARQFAHPTFVSEVKELVEFHAVDARLLKFELTESMLITHEDEVIARMQALRELGISFALDDFGTGYSSLAYLKRLPLAQIKIDRSFTDDILNDPYDSAICRAILALSQTMELEVVAEGIETAEQWTYLKAAGCRHGQGYYFGRPMPPEALRAWADKQQAVAPESPETCPDGQDRALQDRSLEA